MSSKKLKTYAYLVPATRTDVSVSVSLLRSPQCTACVCVRVCTACVCAYIYRAQRQNSNWHLKQ